MPDKESHGREKDDREREREREREEGTKEKERNSGTGKLIIQASNAFEIFRASNRNTQQRGGRAKGKEKNGNRKL